MYKLARFEQETVIRWDKESSIASIDTADPVIIRKLDKLVAAYPDTYRCTREDALYTAKRYECPKTYVRFGKPLSERQLEANRKRAVKAGFGKTVREAK